MPGCLSLCSALPPSLALVENSEEIQVFQSCCPSIALWVWRRSVPKKPSQNSARCIALSRLQCLTRWPSACGSSKIWGFEAVRAGTCRGLGRGLWMHLRPGIACPGYSLVKARSCEIQTKHHPVILQQHSTKLSQISGRGTREVACRLPGVVSSQSP